VGCLQLVALVATNCSLEIFGHMLGFLSDFLTFFTFYLLSFLLSGIRLVRLYESEATSCRQGYWTLHRYWEVDNVGSRVE